MKTVKFNLPATVHMIPDEEYVSFKKETEDLRRKDNKAWLELHKSQSSPFEHKQVEKDEVIDIPNWWYDAYKHVEANTSVAFDNIVDGSGMRRAFDMKEAKMYGKVDDVNNTMTKVKLFELVKVAKNGNQ